MRILGLYLGMGVFRAESSDLLHMGVYTGMGVITGEYGSALHGIVVSSSKCS